jgi:hypothetical protein
MKEIENKSWKVLDKEGKEVNETLLMIISYCINIGTKENEFPSGIEGFRLLRRISESFDNADKSGKIIFEDKDYEIVKKCVEKFIPANWSANPNVFSAIESFLNLSQILKIN